MNTQFLNHLSTILNEEVSIFKPVLGGDISKAFQIHTEKRNYFIKLNSDPNAQELFNAERMGLEAIDKTKTIAVPKVEACGQFNNLCYLVLEFIESKSPTEEDFYTLGNHLAKLHEHSSDDFGLDHDNFIGSLPQSNSKHSSWVDFYVTERLLPQLQLATHLGRLTKNEIPTSRQMVHNLKGLFENVRPSLVHGDLWSGNYVISKQGVPYLIDPAVYYGHYEVDIAMSKLFGGFGKSFYDSHAEYFQNSPQMANRIEIHQLYHLLVHLNLFGSTYYSSVKRILENHF